jgi:uncharacterized protein YneF (UPF0154 family)
MKVFSRLISVLAVAALFASAALAGERAPATPILPQQFAGWQLSGPAQSSTDPSAADPVNAALLKEYGFTDFASGAYTRDDGRKLSVKAARFADASGAYGAFTYYKVPQMITEQIGDQGSSLNERVLFYRGNILVDAVFAKLSAMSAAELRALADAVPLPSGEARNLPSLPRYLPRAGYVKNTAKYVVGPVGLEKISGPLPAQLVDFSVGAEVVVGDFNTTDGRATLMLISYPTPQIAAEHLRRIDAARRAFVEPAGGPPVSNLAPRRIAPGFDKRSGPLVIVAIGALSPSEAQSLLSAVNYDADVTWNENTHFTKKDNLANLLVNIIILCGILIGFALVVGVAFGGIRVLIQRVLPEKIFDRPEVVEFISLHLSENGDKPADSKVSSSINAV